MEFIFEQALKFEAVILQAGDLSDSPRDWFVLSCFALLLRKYNEVKFYCIPGQHDTYMRSPIDEAPTTMGVLIKAGLIHLLSSKATVFEDFEGERIKVYGAGWREKIPIMSGSEKKILVAHASVAEGALFPGHNYIDLYNFLSWEVNSGVILVGDVHRKFQAEVDGRIILNTGPLIRREASEYNMTHDPGFFLYDTRNEGSIEHIVVPHKSADEVFSRIKKKEVNEERKIDLRETIAIIKDLQGDRSINIKNIVAKALESNKISDFAKKVIMEAFVDEN